MDLCSGGELLTAREAALLLVGKQISSFNDRGGPEEDEHAWSELVMDIGGLRSQMTGAKSEPAPHLRLPAEGTPFSSRRAAAESIRLSNILGRLHRQRGGGKGSRLVEARAWMATVLLLLDSDAVVRDTAARAVARGLASGLVRGSHDETGLHLVGMEAAAGVREGDDGAGDGCVLGQGAKCLMHEGEEECLQRRDGAVSRAKPQDSHGGLNPYVACQAAARYLMSVFGDEPCVSKFINVAIAASSKWNCPAPPRPFIDIGYGAVPQYVPTPASHPGKAAHHEEEEEEEGTGEAALLLRLVEDGLQVFTQLSPSRPPLPFTPYPSPSPSHPFFPLISFLSLSFYLSLYSSPPLLRCPFFDSTTLGEYPFGRRHVLVGAKVNALSSCLCTLAQLSILMCFRSGLCSGGARRRRQTLRVLMVGERTSLRY
jgi:hypothetical protein